MAYHESFSSKVGKLVTNPRGNLNKIIPFLKSKAQGPARRLRESLGDFSRSKPYSGHDDLIRTILIAYTEKISGGYFVHVGGNDGYFDDPTYYLEKALGWNGVIVEPLPIWKLAQKNRKGSVVVNYAAVSYDTAAEKNSVELVDTNAMSSIKGSRPDEDEWVASGEKAQNMKSRTITVPAATLDQIIQDTREKVTRGGQNPLARKIVFNEIDLLVIDVEGYELEVLKGFDIGYHEPMLIMLEIQDEASRKEISDYLAGYGYEQIAEVGNRDFIFTR